MDVRSQLVDKITSCLQGITKAHGFQTDIGAKVFPWRKAPMDANSIPGIIWRDQDAHLPLGHDDDEVPIGRWEHNLKVTVDVFFKGSTSASEARKALADVVSAFYPPTDKVGRWDGLAERTELVGHAINTDQEGDVICGAHLAFIIVYQTPVGTL